ncbi:MAG TPA: NADP-dependent oxidoreductase [Opitutaceae bacterium]|nr:NADP-dependent oxidoreductase [Opitutaceae bacterium]
MKAIRIHRVGGPDVLQVDDIARPEPGDDEVLISVHACGVNPVDTKIRAGEFPLFKPELPAILGRDIAGSVERVGKHVKGWLEGEPVFGMLDYERGAYAEFALASPLEIARKPSKLDAVRAAGVPMASLTAWQSLFDLGDLRAGERVLIHGGSGGVGHFAIQFAKNVGAEVFTTASAKDREFLRGLGAQRVIDYKSERFEEIVSEADLVLDLIGGETRERSWGVLKNGGRLVTTIGQPEVPAHAPKKVSAWGTVVKADPDQLAKIGQLIDEGKISVVVSDVFPLADARAAHDDLANGHKPGKIVLSMT